MTSIPTPLLKWPGGKGKLAGTLAPILTRAFRQKLQTMNRAFYLEPFLGSGVIAITVGHELHAERAQLMAAGVPWAFLTDLSPVPVCVLKAAMDTPEAFAVRLNELRAAYAEAPEPFFLANRSILSDALQAASRNAPVDELDLAARALLLNRTGYNGLWRVAANDRCNTPWGRNTTSGGWARASDDQMRAIGNAIEGAALGVTPAQAIFNHFNTDVAHLVIFADAPYGSPVPEERQPFAGYTAQGFKAADQGALVETLQKLADGGATIVYTNQDTPGVRNALGAAWRIIKASEARSINTDSTGRGPVPTLIATRNAPE